MSNLSENRRTRISKAMSYLLRHHPEKGDLQPDPEGYVPLDDLVEALHSLGRDATAGDVREVVQQDPKGRYEIRGDMIRATYGHSFDIAESGEECVPPDTLYHGTPRRSVEAIMQEGLRPMQRQWVHLSATVEEARKVGQRRDSKPAILAIDAYSAHEDGITFRRAGSVYLSPHIPPEYIEVQQVP
ncbi:MAG: RNA 2'-phosphotransferase [Armatimonadota bacterium]